MTKTTMEILTIMLLLVLCRKKVRNSMLMRESRPLQTLA